MRLICFVAPALAFIIKQNVDCLGWGPSIFVQLNLEIEFFSGSYYMPPIRSVLQPTPSVLSCSRTASQFVNSSPKQRGTPFPSLFIPRSLEIYVYVSGVDCSAVCSRAPPRGDGLDML